MSERDPHIVTRSCLFLNRYSLYHKEFKPFSRFRFVIAIVSKYINDASPSLTCDTTRSRKKKKKVHTTTWRVYNILEMSIILRLKHRAKIILKKPESREPQNLNISLHIRVKATPFLLTVVQINFLVVGTTRKKKHLNSPVFNFFYSFPPFFPFTFFLYQSLYHHVSSSSSSSSQINHSKEILPILLWWSSILCCSHRRTSL